MKSDQELLSESRILINKINKENNVHLCAPLVDEFLERYEIWPSLQRIYSSLDHMRTDDQKNLLVFEKKAFEEIHAAYLAIHSYSEQQGIAISKIHIDEYEQVFLSSAGFTSSRFEAVRDMLLSLDSKGHRTFVGNFTVLAPSGGFYSCIFSPSYIKWHEKRDELSNRPWYSFDQLIRLKNKEPYDAKFPFLDKNDLPLRKLQNRMSFAGQKIDISNYKPHVEQFHKYTKQILLNQAKIADTLNQTLQEKCRTALEKNHLKDFSSSFKSLIGDIPYQIQQNSEGYYHTILYLTIGGRSEDSTSNGSIDLVYETGTHVYIFEVKFNRSTQQALKQIHEKRYYEKFTSSGKIINLTGISINKDRKKNKVRKIDFAHEKLPPNQYA